MSPSSRLTEGFAPSSVAGGAASRIDPASTAFHPAWRRAIAEVAISEPVDTENTPVETVRAAQERLKESTKVLDTITTDSAAYYNEVRSLFSLFGPWDGMMTCMIAARPLYMRWTSESRSGAPTIRS